MRFIVAWLIKLIFHQQENGVVLSTICSYLLMCLPTPPSDSWPPLLVDRPVSASWVPPVVASYHYHSTVPSSWGLIKVTPYLRISSPASCACDSFVCISQFLPWPSALTLAKAWFMFSDLWFVFCILLSATCPDLGLSYALLFASSLNSTSQLDWL